MTTIASRGAVDDVPSARRSQPLVARSLGYARPRRAIARAAIVHRSYHTYLPELLAEGWLAHVVETKAGAAVGRRYARFAEIFTAAISAQCGHWLALEIAAALPLSPGIAPGAQSLAARALAFPFPLAFAFLRLGNLRPRACEEHGGQSSSSQAKAPTGPGIESRSIHRSLLRSVS